MQTSLQHHIFLSVSRDWTFIQHYDVKNMNKFSFWDEWCMFKCRIIFSKMSLIFPEMWFLWMCWLLEVILNDHWFGFKIYHIVICKQISIKYTFKLQFWSLFVVLIRHNQRKLIILNLIAFRSCIPFCFKRLVVKRKTNDLNFINCWRMSRGNFHLD